MGSIKSETIKSAKWSFIQKLTLQPVQMVFSMILARLVTPEEMGILGLTAIFFAIATCLANAGFGAAIIRKTDRTTEDINTVFWFNLVMSLLLALILFMLAPWFADFYRQPELLLLTRVSAFMLFLSSSSSVHVALFQSRRDFKTLAWVGMLSTLAGMPVCLYLAYIGWGIWALMIQNVVSTTISLGLIWWRSPWKPSFIFSWISFRDLFAFGSRLSCASMLHTIYAETRTFIIGKFYSASQLGLYNRGQHLANLGASTINGVLESITYPILATIQNDKSRLKSAYQKYIKISTIVIAWFCILLVALAKPCVYILYGERWLSCAIFIQILSFDYMFSHICSINLNLLKVKGKSGIILRLEFIKKIISTVILIYAATISVEAICWGMVIYNQIAIFLNCIYTGKLIGLSWWQQQKDYLPYFILAIISAIPAYCITRCDIHEFFQLIIGAGISAVIYFGFLYFTKEEACKELFHEIAIRIFNKKKQQL